MLPFADHAEVNSDNEKDSEKLLRTISKSSKGELNTKRNV